MRRFCYICVGAGVQAGTPWRPDRGGYCRDGRGIVIIVLPPQCKHVHAVGNLKKFMKLVLDTNIIHDDFHLKRPRITKLCSAAPKLGYDLLIPEVVVDEMVNQYRKKMASFLPGYAEVVKMMSRTQEKSDKYDKEAFLQTNVAEYKEFLLKQIAALGIITIPYPSVDIKELVYKDLEVKKPFKEVKDGIIGYRDALIWESIKSICQPPQNLIEDPQIEFLTENTRDFADSGKALHPDLVKELIDTGLAENCVALIPDVNEFFERRIDTELEELDKIKEKLLKEGKYNRFNLLEEAERVLSLDFITDVIDESDFDSGQHRYLPEYVEDPSVSDVGNPNIVEVVVRRLTDQTVLIEVMATVAVELDFFVYKPDYYLLDEDSLPYVINSDWNDHYMWCSGVAYVEAGLSFRTSPKLGKVQSVDVQVMRCEM